MLDLVGLTDEQEMAVLEFCWDISTMPYNRRTSRSLREIIEFITKFKTDDRFNLNMRQGFRWWWAFTKKHSIISLYYENNGGDIKEKIVTPPPSVSPTRQSNSPNTNTLLSLINDPSSVAINLPSNNIFPLFGLNSADLALKRFSYTSPPLAHSNLS